MEWCAGPESSSARCATGRVCRPRKLLRYPSKEWWISQNLDGQNRLKFHRNVIYVMYNNNTLTAQIGLKMRLRYQTPTSGGPPRSPPPLASVPEPGDGELRSEVSVFMSIKIL